MKVALVHDWLTGMRGGEKVLEVLCERFPEAELFTLLHVPRIGFAGHRAATDPHVGCCSACRASATTTASACRSFRRSSSGSTFDGFDLVLSTSHCVAKSALAAPGAMHICYCLTPMRYAWDQFDAYFGPERLGPAGQPR